MAPQVTLFTAHTNSFLPCMRLDHGSYYYKRLFLFFFLFNLVYKWAYGVHSIIGITPLNTKETHILQFFGCLYHLFLVTWAPLFILPSLDRRKINLFNPSNEKDKHPG